MVILKYMNLYFPNMKLTHRLILQSDLRIARGPGGWKYLLAQQVLS